MGGEQSKQEDGLVYISTRNHPVFGEVKLYRRNNENVMLLCKCVQDGDQFNLGMEAYSKRKDYNNQNLIQVYDYKLKRTADLCSQISYIQLTVEHLSDEIETYKERFTEKELFYLIFSITDAMNYCRLQNNEINDLHPSKVFLTDDGRVRLIDNIVAAEHLSNYHQIRYNDRQLEYLAPEQLELFNDHKLKLDQEKCNVYCLGLLIAFLITRHPISDYYQEETIDTRLLFKRLSSAIEKQHHSDKLVTLLDKMLDEKPENRPTYQQILSMRLTTPFVQQLDSEYLYQESPKKQSSIKSSQQLESMHQPIQLAQASTHHHQVSQQLSQQLIVNNCSSKGSQRTSFLRDTIRSPRENQENHLDARIQSALQRSDIVLNRTEHQSVQLRKKISFKPPDTPSVRLQQSIQNPLNPLSDSRIVQLLIHSEDTIQKSFVQK